jgi:hypothetical protein
MKQKLIVSNNFVEFEAKVNEALDNGYSIVPTTLCIVGGTASAVDVNKGIEWKNEFRYAIVLYTNK